MQTKELGAHEQLVAEGAAHYSYDFVDRSIVLRVVRRPLLDPMVRMLPFAITPNAITVAGHVAAWGGLAFLIAAPAYWLAWIAAALGVLIYGWFDCLDGMHARNTGRASKRGELLDHWLDSLTVPLVPFVAGLATGQPMSLVVLGTAVVSFLHASTLLHGYRVGHVEMGAVGILEGSILTSLLLVAEALFGEAITRPIIWGASIANVLLIGTIAGSLFAFVSMPGLKGHKREVLALALGLGLAGLWCEVGNLPSSLAGLLIIAVGAAPDGRITVARLCRTRLVAWDFALLALLAAGSAASLLLHPGFYWQLGMTGVVFLYVLVATWPAFLGAVEKTGK